LSTCDCWSCECSANLTPTNCSAKMSPNGSITDTRGIGCQSMTML